MEMRQRLHRMHVWFGKVYFPRLTVPISNVLCSVIRFGNSNAAGSDSARILYMERGCQSSLGSTSSDFFTFTMAWLHGDGSRDSDLRVTTKYRDLSVLVGFGMSLWMYGTPVVYPMSFYLKES